MLCASAGGDCPSACEAAQTATLTSSFIQSRFWGRGCDEALFSVKEKGVFSEKRGGNSVNGGFGKDFYRQGNSVKRFGPFREPPDSEK